MTLDHLKTLSRKQILDEVLAVSNLLPEKQDSATSRFEFVLNSSLSPSASECSELQCRVRRGFDAGRFASLYADKIYIPNFVEELTHYSHLPLEDMRIEFSRCISIIHSLKLLISADLLGFVGERRTHICRRCLINELKENARTFEDRTDYLHRLVAEEVVNRLRFEVANISRKEIEVVVSGDGDILNHPYYWTVEREIFPNLRRGLLTRTEIVDSGIFHSKTEEIVNDIVRQDYYRTKYGTNYVTGRRFDFDIIGAFGDSEISQRNRAISQAFSHNVPLFEAVDIQHAITLRKDAGDVFQAYRDSITSAIREVSTGLDEAKFSQAFDDLIRPKLHDIDLKVGNYRRTCARSIKQDVVAASGFIGVGLFVGLLEPTLGAAIAGLGGYQPVRDMVGKLSGLVDEPDEVKNDPMYFLWKVTQQP